jgi:hypothetical protein
MMLVMASIEGMTFALIWLRFWLGLWCDAL